MQFVREQRIRSLLQGSWFPVTPTPSSKAEISEMGLRKVPWRYVRLSHNRRFLHYCDYESETTYEPKLEELPQKSLFAPNQLPSQMLI